MLPCRRYAFFVLARDAGFVTLAGATMMVGASYWPPIAFDIGATVALLFCLILLLRSYLLTDERFRRSEAWRSLLPEERPFGDAGLTLARQEMHELMLRFAKGAAAVAGLLYGSALITVATSTAEAGIY